MVIAGTTVEIAENVYIIPDQRVPLVPNVGIIVGTEGVLVVGTGMGPANAEIILDEVRKITDLPIRYLVTTHFHPEHYYGAQSFPEETLILVSTAQRQDLREKGEAYIDFFVELFGDDVSGLLAPVQLIPPDMTFARKARVDLGNLPVELRHFGYAAHTRGDTVVYLPNQRLLFAGGLTPNRFFPIFPDPDSSLSGWLASLEELEQLEIALLVPGHGEVTDEALIDTVKTYLTQVRDAALQLKADGVSLSDAQAQLSSQIEAQHADWDEPNWIAAAVENVYSEADSLP